MAKVVIYTDGAAEPNPGPGGYGVVLIWGKRRKELNGGFRRTTNNRMEILAAIKALEALKVPCHVKLYSDSKYLVDSMTKGWARHWRARGWRRSSRDEAVNTDLWQRLLDLCDRHRVEFAWVKGHAGNRWNERADELSVQALKRPLLPDDPGYEPPPEAEALLEDEPSARPAPRPTPPGPAAKITREGQPCRKCSTPVVRRTPRRNGKPGRSYYFEYYLYCPECGTMYMVEEAKRYYE